VQKRRLGRLSAALQPAVMVGEDMHWVDPSTLELNERLCEQAALGEDVLEAVVARTDGVPLFVEELTRSVVEGDRAAGAIPATLQDTLMARLNRLGEAREVIQIATKRAPCWRRSTAASPRPWPTPTWSKRAPCSSRFLLRLRLRRRCACEGGPTRPFPGVL